jgi:enamine deaminase RidA (YjgF/YER057c/UK114 family)
MMYRHSWEVAVNELVNPTDLAAPAANYSHGVVAVHAERLLYTSGVVPTRADGSVPADLADQAATVWSNLAAITKSAGFDTGDVVSVTTYVVAGHDLGVVMAARDKAMAGHKPASTLVVVPSLARPEWKMEIALVAAR